MATNPLVAQGTLNRVRNHVASSSYPALNISAAYMGKTFARLEFEGSFNEQIGTGTGGVSSPEPYVWATITVGLLRTQALSQAWMDQAIAGGDIGDITAYADSAAFSAITLNGCVIRSIDPGAYDGTDPVVRLVLRGTFYLNNSMWSY